MNKLTPEQRDTIDRCRSCDSSGIIEILPPDQHNHATCARCPHDPHRIVEIKRTAETQRAAHNRHHAKPNPVQPDHADA